MNVAILPSDTGGVGYYRLIAPALELACEDVRINLLSGLPMRLNNQGERIGVARNFRPDVFVMQRPTNPAQLVALRDLRSKGVRVVVDVDDDFHAVPAHNPAFNDTHPRTRSGESLMVLRDVCREADLLTVSTPALAARYGAHGRVVVLPNCVAKGWLDITPAPDTGVIGWTGTLTTHRGDLAITRGGVARALEQTGGTFRVIGNPNGVRGELDLSDEPEVVKWQSFQDYPFEVSRLSVGIAPLADTAFSRAKSWLKPLEQAAVGVPCVMSPTDEYTRLHNEHGIGVLAGWRSREWKRETARLLTDDAWRQEVSERSRVGAAELMIENHAWRWLEAWAEPAFVP